VSDLLSNLPDDLGRAVEFHGHLCPGLAMGYRAARIAMRELGADRPEDEGLVAVVENDTCAVDAVQFLTGCTFGKGNLVFRDYGKQVLTLAVRPSGRAVRVALRPRDQGDEGEEEPSREERIRLLLEAPEEELFSVRHLTAELPPKAEIRPSVRCDLCGEPVMDTRARRIDGLTLCIPCADARADGGEPPPG